MGAGIAGAAVGGLASGQSAAAEVSGGNGSFTATNGGSTVYSGGDLIDAIQAAVDSLTPGRTTRERVLVTASGSVGPHSWDGDVHAVDLPSYTILDVQGTIDVQDTGDDLIVPVRAQSVEAIEIPNIRIEGNPRYGIWIQSCSDVTLGTVEAAIPESSDVGIAVRIDDSDGGQTTGVTIDSATVNGSAGHGVETYGVDDLTIGTVTTTDTGGCGLLLNATSNATVEHVDATRADEGGGYAGFRCANDAGPNVSVGRVDAVGCGRGIFTVSGSQGIEIDEVYLENNGGNLIQDTRDLTIHGGTVTGTGGSGFRIDSRSEDTHPYTRNVTIERCRIENSGNYGVRETGPDTESNTIRENSFCNNASGAVSTYASNTTVTGNVYDCSGGVPGGDTPTPEPTDTPTDEPATPTPCEPTAITPYLRVDGGSWQNTSSVTIQSGSSVEFGPQPTQGGSWSWSGPGLSASTREVTVSPSSAGTTTYTATYTNDCGETSTQAFTVTVESVATPTPTDSGCDAPAAPAWDDGTTPYDVDGDGVHEDLNGNCEFDSDDVVTYFQEIDRDEIQSNPSYYDANGNGNADFDDVVTLFQSL